MHNRHIGKEIGVAIFYKVEKMSLNQSDVIMFNDLEMMTESKELKGSSLIHKQSFIIPSVLFLSCRHLSEVSL